MADLLINRAKRGESDEMSRDEMRRDEKRREEETREAGGRAHFARNWCAVHAVR